MMPRLLATALTVGLLAACSGSNPEPAPSSTAPTSPPSSSAPATSPPAPSVVQLHSGTVTVAMTGGLKTKLVMPLFPPGASSWQPPPGQITLSYQTRKGNAVLLDGTMAGASATTSSDLTLSFVVQGQNPLVFSSAAGECRIRLTKTTASSFSGRFTCTGLSSTGSNNKKIDATGTFDAKG